MRMKESVKRRCQRVWVGRREKSVVGGKAIKKKCFEEGMSEWVEKK